MLQSVIPTKRVQLLSDFIAMAATGRIGSSCHSLVLGDFIAVVATGRIGPATRSFAATIGNFTHHIILYY